LGKRENVHPRVEDEEVWKGNKQTQNKGIGLFVGGEWRIIAIKFAFKMPFRAFIIFLES